ncbi:aminoacyl-tRNA hydrolase [Aromatoleum buckelii]|nr:aminoacyl-tRNA hydrolase [Aromatoleum buckelii]MCK0510753.1 aminoacyl-tRNA hydrolase [Aromatoleum buckelii]
MRPRLDAVTFVAITGSAGKTGAKDLAAAVLQVLGPCQMSSVSTNDHFGVAETVLGTTRRHRFSVVEMGAPRPGYLDRSLRMVRPRIAVLTLVARDHFTRYKSVEAIAAEKGKVVSALPPDGIAVLNIDDPLVRAIGESCGRRVIWFGQREGATVRLREARSRYPEPLTLTVDYAGRIYEIATALHGTHQAPSVLIALCVGLAAGVPMETAIAALAKVPITPARMEIMSADNDAVFIRDDWKAPVWSFQAPLDFLREARAERKVAIIGTLSDYSLSASKLYPKIARQVREVADLAIFVGPHALRALKARSKPDDLSILAFPDIRAAAEHLHAALGAGDLVLVKGSHKADHLTRLILDRTERVLCWDDRCRRGTLCERCPKLRDPAFASGPPEPVSRRLFTRAASSEEESVVAVVGLGNAGVQFDGTPHNVGRGVLDELVRSAGKQWIEEGEGHVCSIVVEGLGVKLLKPSGAINQCGPKVRDFLERTGVDVRRCILVHDDMDLMLGDVRIKRDGGDAGHKGVRSVIAALGTGSFARVRVGVRKEGERQAARNLVLTKYSATDEAPLALGVGCAAKQVLELIGGPPGSSRELFNTGGGADADKGCGELSSTV